MGYRIGSFNIRDFSKASVSESGTGKTRKDLDTIAKIIRENSYDIVAIQEMSDREPLKELLEKISNQFAEINPSDILKRGNYSTPYNRIGDRTQEIFAFRTKHWEGRWARPKSFYGGNIAEGYGFIWNRDRISLVNNRDNKVFEPRIADFGNSKSLVRPPFIGRFMPKNARYEFRLINTHIAYGVPKFYPQVLNEEELAEDTTIAMDDTQFRKREFYNLIETIYADYCTQVFDKTRHDLNSRGLVPYTFLLGDYNLNLSESDGQSSARLDKKDECISVQTDSSLKIITVNNSLTTLKDKPRTPEKEAELRNDPVEKNHLANNYDHFSYDINNLIRHNIAQPNVGVLFAYREFDGLETETESKYDLYRRNISDHLPIYLDIDIRKRMF